MADIIALNQSNFDIHFQDKKLMFIDFWAPWCEPCKDFDRVFSQVAEKFPALCFGKINVDEEVELAKDFQIRSVPTLIIIRNQVVILQQVGLLPEKAFTDLIEQALSIEDVKFG